MEDRITIDIVTPKPNRFFDAALTRGVRFLRCSAAIACAECGRRSKHHWTLLVPFTAQTMPRNAFDLTSSGTRHAALTPVCRSHLLAMAQGTDSREVPHAHNDEKGDAQRCSST